MIFVLGHYLFLEAHSFPRASLTENCSLLGTDNVRGQISVHIFAPNGDYCLYNHPARGDYNTEVLIFKMAVARFLDVFKEETSKMKENAVALIIT